MEKQNIIVIGASAGGFEILKKMVADFPPDFEASIFIVWHISPNVTGMMPHVLSRLGNLPATNAVNGEAIETGRIYVAPPDHHLLIERERVRVTKGPKENRFRPAIDPLFRSAAHAFGKRVIGVILSGALDDGTSGLWMIKQRGGLAVVQDPLDAEVPSMPRHAIREVKVDYIVPADEIAGLLVRLSGEQVETSGSEMEKEDLNKLEINIAAEDSAFENGIMNFGDPSPFSCPDCHGVLFKLQEGERERYRCHTGHAFSADSLLSMITENIETSLWNAMRGVEESIILLNHLGAHLAENGQINLSALYFKKAFEAKERIAKLRETVMSEERLSRDSISEQAEEN